MKKLKTIGFAVLIACLSSSLFSQSIYYVDAAMADNSGNGTSWATAKKDVQDAIDASSAGDQIWVKKGVYKPKNYPATMFPVADSYPAGSPLLPLSDRDNMFFLKNNQKIYGGFVGTETNINQRTAILGSNKTTFSGDVGTVGDSTDNCYHILVYLAPDAGAVAPTIDGIHFEGANANSFYGQTIIPGAAFGSVNNFGLSRSYGGAVFINLGTNGQINNCSFRRNFCANRGACVWFDGGFGTTRKINVTRSFFYENRSSVSSYGAAISFNYGENTVANNVFYKNYAAQGSAFFQVAGEAKIYSNTFVKNTANLSGIAIFSSNGDSALMYNNLFYQNISGNTNGFTNSFGADFQFPGTYYTTPNPVFGGANLNFSWDNLAKNNLLELSPSEYNNTTYPQHMNTLGTGAVGNIYQQNPDFQNINDLDGLDNILGTADDGLIPGASSPVVNAGDSTLALSATGNFDISNYDRIEGGNINMGAYERSWAPCFVNETFTVTSCDSFLFNGETYTMSGNYSDTLYATTCDTIVQLNLTILSSSSSSITIDTCQAFVLNNQLFSNSGTYTQVLPNAAGCDSTITLTVLIAPLTNSINIDTCSAIVLNNQLLSSSGTYTQTLTNSFGCDSILTITLTITPISGSLNMTECGSATVNGQVFAASGTYTQNFITSNGCDSTLIINLTIVPLPTLTASITNPGVYCENEAITLTASGADTYIWDNGITNGVAFLPAVGVNLYVVTGTANGCTSSLQVPVTVGSKPIIEATASSTSVCEFDSIYFSGNGALIYNYLTPDFSYGEWFYPNQLGSSIYLMEGIGVNGCRDTVSITIELRDRPLAPNVSLLADSTCFGHAINPAITAIPVSGVIEWFTDEKLTNSLEVNNMLNEDENITGITSYYASDFANNCYSPATEVQITVFALPEVDAGPEVVSTAHETATLSGNVSNTVDYYWTNTLNSLIDSALSFSFLTTASGEYTLHAISSEGCMDSSKVLITINKPFVSGNYVSANGDGNNDTWQVHPLEKISGCTVRIFNTFGQIVFESDNYKNDWAGDDLPDGDYYFEITCDGDRTVGSITLIH